MFTSSNSSKHSVYTEQDQRVFVYTPCAQQRMGCLEFFSPNLPQSCCDGRRANNLYAVYTAGRPNDQPYRNKSGVAVAAVAAGSQTAHADVNALPTPLFFLLIGQTDRYGIMHPLSHPSSLSPRACLVVSCRLRRPFSTPALLYCCIATTTPPTHLVAALGFLPYDHMCTKMLIIRTV